MKKLLFIPLILFVGLIGYIVYREIKAVDLKRALTAQIANLRQQVQLKDSTLGEYETLVDNLQFKERDLRKQVESLKNGYSADIKANNERILSVSKYNLALKNQLDTLKLKLSTADGVVTADIEDYYPDEKDWFIKYTGLLQFDKDGVSPVLAREFSFRPINIDLVLTEQANGSWMQRMNAPSYISINATVNSLPAKEFIPSKPRVKLVAGAGVSFMYTQAPQLHLSGGATLKDWTVLLNGSTAYMGLTVLKHFNR